MRERDDCFKTYADCGCDYAQIGCEECTKKCEQCGSEIMDEWFYIRIDNDDPESFEATNLCSFCGKLCIEERNGKDENILKENEAIAKAAKESSKEKATFKL